jgi:hypothetical protein
MTTNNRANVVTAIGTMMAAFIAANPTLLLRHFKVRPTGALTDWPMSYLDLRPTTISYDSSLRETNFTPSIVFVDRPTDNGQTADRFDALIDAFTDFLDTRGHIDSLIANSVWSTGTFTEEAVPLGDETFAAGVRFTFGPITFLNGT